MATPGEIGPFPPPVGAVLPGGGYSVPPASIGPTPGEIEENKGLWRGFFDRLKTDPNFKTSVLMTGLQMMRSKRPGENEGDVIGQSLQSGVQMLDLLQQRDRTQRIEGEERARKAGLEERQTKSGERQVGAIERQAGVAEREADIRGSDVAQKYTQAKAELDEAIRHNKAQEEIDRLRAQADNLRASFYASSRKGMGGAEVQKMNALSAQFQAQGFDEVAADAMAVQYLQEKGKGKAPADRIRSMVEERIKAYTGSLEALDKPLTNDMIRQWFNESIALDKQLEGIGNPQAVMPPVAPVQGPGRAPTGPAGAPPAAAAPPASGAPPPAPVAAAPGVTAQPPDPVLHGQIQAALARGVDPGQLRARVIQMGKNPADYGL